MSTDELLGEPIYAAYARERSAIDGLLAEVGRRVVLFGAGKTGQKVASALLREGIEILAFADNDRRLTGTLVAGIPVLLPQLAAERWAREALFIVTTFLPTGGGIGARITELSLLGCTKITSFLLAGWKYDGILPHFAAARPSEILQHAAELAKVGSLWADDKSRETYKASLEWRLRARFENVQEPSPDQYFPCDILRPCLEEVFVDGGAYDGDTLRAARWPLSKVIAIEPDPVNAAQLRAVMGSKIELHEVLLGSSPGSARFDGNGTMASSRSEAGALSIRIATLDELSKATHPTFIKLDVEGDELEALRGGKLMLRSEKPVVAVCVYHRPEDLWTIPLFLHETLGEHRMYLREHGWNGFELVVYALPEMRCLSHK